MASVVGAIRNALGDRWWLFKLAFGAYVVYFLKFHLALTPQSSTANIIIYVIVGLLILGCSCVSISRNINNQYPLFPSLFSIPEVISKTIGGTISLIIGSIVAAILGYLSLLLVNFFLSYTGILEQLTQSQLVAVKIAFTFILEIIAVPFVFVPIVLYCATNKLKNAFRFDIVFKCAGDVIIRYLMFILQYIVIIGISYICLFFFLLQMFGTNDYGHISVKILASIYTIISIFLFSLYISDLYDDVIPAIKTKG